MKIAHKVGLAAATVLFLTTSLLSLLQVTQVRDTLRSQIIYPSQATELTDDQLLELLAVLHPSVLSQVQVAEPPANATEAMLACTQQARAVLLTRRALYAPI